MVTLADRTALDHSRFRESSPIVRGPSPIGPSRESLNVHRIFLCWQRKKKARGARIGEHLLLSIRFFPSVPNYARKSHAPFMKCPIEYGEEKKTLPPETPFEGLDGLPVSWCCRVQKVDKVRSVFARSPDSGNSTVDFLDDKIKCRAPNYFEDGLVIWYVTGFASEKIYLFVSLCITLQNILHFVF